MAKTNWKERYKRLRARAGGAARGAARGAKDSAKLAGGGAAGAVLAQVAAPYVPASIPYGTAAALAVAGHFARRKYPQIGTGMLGAAGALLMLEVFQKHPNLAASLPGANRSAATQAQGFWHPGDAGAFYGYHDAGALQEAALAEAAGYDAGAFQDAEVAGFYEDGG